MALEQKTFTLTSLASDTQTLQRFTGLNTIAIDVVSATGNFELVIEGSPDGVEWNEKWNSGTVSDINDKNVEIGVNENSIRCTVTDKSGSSNVVVVYATPFLGNVPTGELEDITSIDFDLVPGVSSQEGRLFWDNVAKTLALGLTGGDVTLQIGQENHMYVLNDTGVQIDNGTPVFIIGSDGDNFKVSPSSASVHLLAMATIAVATEDIADGDYGYCTTFGIVRDIDTDFVSADGRPAFLSATTGELSASLPTQPNSQVFVGVVLKKHATEGAMLVKLIGQPNIGELSNILISSILDGQVLQYDYANAVWKNVEGSPTRTEWDKSGFDNRTDSTLTWTDTLPNRTLSIQPTEASFDYWIAGIKYTSTGDTVQITDTEGMHAIYYVGSTLTSLANPTDAQISTAIRTTALVSLVYWSKTNDGIYIGDERHGKIMSSVTHAYLHFLEGCRWNWGLGLNTMSVDGTGITVDAQFGIDTGAVSDEDIYYEIDAVTPTTGLPIYYMIGADAEWRKSIVSGFSARTEDGTTATRLAFNEYTGGAWQLTEESNGDYVLYHIFATTEKDNPMIAVMGQNGYSSRRLAREGATTEIHNLVLNNILFPEIRPIATIIYQTRLSYANDINARVISTDEGDDYIDWRNEVVSRTEMSTSNHGALTGLANDDHTQYLLADGSRSIGGNLLPDTDDTYYLGKNDDDSPFAFKGLILKDTTNGKYYRIEIISGTITATDLTD